jgi:hypothetical protein
MNSNVGIDILILFLIVEVLDSIKEESTAKRSARTFLVFA